MTKQELQAIAKRLSEVKLSWEDHEKIQLALDEFYDEQWDDK